MFCVCFFESPVRGGSVSCGQVCCEPHLREIVFQLMELDVPVSGKKDLLDIICL